MCTIGIANQLEPFQLLHRFELSISDIVQWIMKSRWLVILLFGEKERKQMKMWKKGAAAAATTNLEIDLQELHCSFTRSGVRFNANCICSAFFSSLLPLCCCCFCYDAAIELPIDHQIVNRCNPVSGIFVRHVCSINFDQTFQACDACCWSIFGSQSINQSESKIFHDSKKYYFLSNSSKYIIKQPQRIKRDMQTWKNKYLNGLRVEMMLTLFCASKHIKVRRIY